MHDETIQRFKDSDWLRSIRFFLPCRDTIWILNLWITRLVGDETSDWIFEFVTLLWQYALQENSAHPALSPLIPISFPVTACAQPPVKSDYPFRVYKRNIEWKSATGIEYADRQEIRSLKSCFKKEKRKRPWAFGVQPDSWRIRGCCVYRSVHPALSFKIIL